MAPVLGFGGETRDVGVVAAGDHVGELEVGLARAVRVPGDRLGAPAEEGDRAVAADVLHRGGGEGEKVQGELRAVGEGRRRTRPARGPCRPCASNCVDRAHVPGRRGAGELRRRSRRPSRAAAGLGFFAAWAGLRSLPAAAGASRQARAQRQQPRRRRALASGQVGRSNPHERQCREGHSAGLSGLLSSAAGSSRRRELGVGVADVHRVAGCPGRRRPSRRRWSRSASPCRCRICRTRAAREHAGSRLGTLASASAIQAAFEPPCSLEPTSPIIIGFDGSDLLGDLAVGRFEQLVEALPALRRRPGWCPSCSRRGSSSRRRRRRGRAEPRSARAPTRVDERAPDPGRRWSAPAAAKMSWTWRQAATYSPGAVAVHALRPGEPVAVHLPVEAQEEGVAPVRAASSRTRGCRRRSCRRSRRRAGSRAGPRVEGIDCELQLRTGIAPCSRMSSSGVVGKL